MPFLQKCAKQFVHFCCRAPHGARGLKSRGVFVFDNTATSANKITAAHVLKPCYMEDDHTVTALATGASVAGTVIRVDDEGVAVECGGYIPAAAAASVGG